MEEKKRKIFIPTIIIAIAVIIGILLAMNLLGPKKINYAGSDKSFEQLVKNTAANTENKEKIEKYWDIKSPHKRLNWWMLIVHLLVSATVSYSLSSHGGYDCGRL